MKGVTVLHYTSFLTLSSSIANFNLGDSLVMLFFFALLLVLLKKFAWGPLMKVMQEREEYVANEIEEAEKSRKEAEIAAKEAAAQLKQTREEAQQIIEDARNAGIKQEQDIIRSAQLEAERLIESAQKDIQLEKEKAIQALQDQVASLSVLIASKVIEKELSATDQEKLIKDYIKEVGEDR